MKEKIGWHHPDDEADQWDGFNDPGIEQFRGDPILHLAREIIQNALDAAKSDSSAVEVEFNLRTIETNSIPNIDELRNNFEKCAIAAEGEGNKAKIFFQNALNELNNINIAVLDVSERNTKGMKGPCTNGTPFYAFMKAKGQSKKDTNTAAGSYGIGKFAPYAVSKIRTIFVSTVYEDSNGFVQLTQGKSILMSHENKKKRKTGNGFWGITKKCMPVEGVPSKIPSWILRANDSKDLQTKKGTKILILCFDEAKDWEDLLAVSVAENFFGAISSNHLKVKICSKYSINKESLKLFFENKDIVNKIEDLKDEPENFQNCRSYLEALTNDSEAILVESQRRDLGLCQLKILIREGLPKKICFLRNGMQITTNLTKLRSFSDFKEFSAVFQCLDSNGNGLLRDMEPPRHDSFEPDRLPSQEEQKRGHKALKEIATWIRTELKEHAKEPVSEVTELEELKDYFGEEGKEDSGKGGEEINPYGRVILRAKPIKIKITKSSNEEPADGGGGDKGKGGGNGGGGTGGGKGGHGGEVQSPEIIVSNVRSIIENSKKRRVAFTPLEGGRIRLRLLESGADSDYRVEIVNSNKGQVQNGGIILEVKPGEREVLVVELSEEFIGAVKVVANEIR